MDRKSRDTDRRLYFWGEKIRAIQATLEKTEKSCQPIYLLHSVFVRKAKMGRKQFELGKRTELHGEGCSSGKAGDETDAQVE